MAATEERYIGLLSRDNFLYTFPEELIRYKTSETEVGLPVAGVQLVSDMFDAHLAINSAGINKDSSLFVANIDGNKPCLDQLTWVSIHRVQTKRTPTVKPIEEMSKMFSKDQLQESLVCSHEFFGM